MAATDATDAMDVPGKASAGLSLGLGLLLILAAWPTTETLRTPLPPPQAAAPDQSADNPPPQEKIRPVLLPPPPAPASPAAAAQPAAVEPKAAPEPAPPRLVKALKPTPAPPPEAAPEPPPEAKPAAAPVTQIEPLKATPPPAPSPAPTPAPKRTAAPAAPKPIDAGKVDVGEGRALLRLLEHGSGPTIELAWPDSAARRVALFRHLERCFGLRVALLDRDERLFVAAGARGLAWDLNLDLYSGFLRRPAGRSVAEEAAEVRRIRLHHGGLAAARAVRLFPRLVDARLLAGLSQLVGPQYRDLTSIRARYRLAGPSLIVERVEADGRPLPGRIDLTPAQARACR